MLMCLNCTPQVQNWACELLTLQWISLPVFFILGNGTLATQTRAAILHTSLFLICESPVITKAFHLLNSVDYNHFSLLITVVKSAGCGSASFRFKNRLHPLLSICLNPLCLVSLYIWSGNNNSLFFIGFFWEVNMMVHIIAFQSASCHHHYCHHHH